MRRRSELENIGRATSSMQSHKEREAASRLALRQARSIGLACAIVMLPMMIVVASTKDAVRYFMLCLIACSPSFCSSKRDDFKKYIGICCHFQFFVFGRVKCAILGLEPKKGRPYKKRWVALKSPTPNIIRITGEFMAERPSWP